MFYNQKTIKYYDLIVVGNSLAAILAAAKMSEQGQRVALVTGSEQLMSEFSETMIGYIPKGSPLLPILKKLGAEPQPLGEEYCLPAGMAAKCALKYLREKGVNIYLKAAPIGLLKTGDVTRGVAVATKFGAYAIKSATVADFSGGEYITDSEKGDGEYIFSFRMKGAAKNLQSTTLPPTSSAYDIRLHPDIYDDTTYGVVFKSKLPRSTRNAAAKLVSTAAEICGNFRETLPEFQEAHMFRYALKPLLAAETKICRENGLIRIQTGDIRNSHLSEITAAVEAHCGNPRYTEPDTLLTSFGSFPLCDLYGEAELDEYLGAEIPEIKIPHENIPELRCDLFIAGLGAGGMAALKGAQTGGIRIAAAEAMPTPGGTRTHGMVSAFWHGYQGGFATKNVKNFVDATETLLGKKAPQSVKEAVYDLKITENHNVFYSSFLFGSVKKGDDTAAVLISTDKGIVKISANKFIDATGDADLSRLSGVEYTENGDHRDFVTQGYSIWGLEKSGTAFPDSIYKNDDDSISTEKYTEYLRAIFLTHSGSSDYGFSPLLTVRESRRIKGKYRLNMQDILKGRSFSDTIAVSLCLYDAHGMGSSPAYYTTVFGGIRGKGTPDVVTRIPLRALLPEKDGGLMVISKAISASRDAGCLIRMNPDIQNTGFAAGVVAGNAAKTDLGFEAAYTEEIKSLLSDMELLPAEYTESREPSAEELIEGVLAGNKQSLVAATVHPEYREQFESRFEGEESMGLLLAALGSHKAFPPLLESFKDRLENYDGSCEKFTNLSTLAVLLSRLATESEEEKSQLLPLLARTTTLADAGGGYGDPARGIYQNSKVSNRIVPNFKALMGLLIAAETLPDESLIKPLRELKNKKNISLRDGDEIHSVQLYLRLLAAAARCGDPDALAEIEAYLDSERLFFRKFAKKELSEINRDGRPTPVAVEPFWI